MKKEITEQFNRICWVDWEGSKFSEFKRYINSLNIPDEAKLYYNYTSTFASIELRREETSAEYEVRLRLEAIKTSAKEKRDKEKYEKLKAKYEK